MPEAFRYHDWLWLMLARQPLFIVFKYLQTKLRKKMPFHLVISRKFTSAL